MTDAPDFNALADKAGISKSYACEIVGNKRVPSRSLAIHIMRTTGWRHPSLSALSDEHIDMLETLEPYRPYRTPSRARAA